MENDPILLEWTISKWQDKRKRNVTPFIILLIILFLPLSVVTSFVPAMIVEAILVLIWNYKYSNPEYRGDEVVESYKITEQGISADNFAAKVRNFYLWTDLFCFESKPGGIPILGMAIPSLANDDIKVTRKDKQTFVLRAPDNKTLEKIGSTLAPKLLIRVPAHGSGLSYSAETLFDIRTGKYYDKDLKDITDSERAIRL